MACYNGGTEAPMNKAIKAILVIGAAYGAFVYIDFMSAKSRAIALARSLSANKGIINLGAGCSRTGFSEAVCELPEVVFNVDLGCDCLKCTTANLEEAPLPFSDKQFDVAFASHVLEHLEHWEQALNEWARIADHVVIVLPNPLAVIGWIDSNHKQHFSLADMQYIQTHWGNISVFT